MSLFLLFKKVPNFDYSLGWAKGFGSSLDKLPYLKIAHIIVNALIVLIGAMYSFL